MAEINPILYKEISEKFLGPKSVLDENNYFQFNTFHLSREEERVPVTVLLKLYHAANNERYVMLSARLSQATKDNDLLEKDILELREKACDFYFSLDKKGLTESVSPSVEDIFGFSQEKIIGKNYFYFVPVANIVQSKRAFEYFSANKQPYRMISDKGMGSDGLENHSELYFTPNFDDKGEFVGYCVLGWIIKKL